MRMRGGGSALRWWSVISYQIFGYLVFGTVSRWTGRGAGCAARSAASCSDFAATWAMRSRNSCSVAVDVEAVPQRRMRRMEREGDTVFSSDRMAGGRGGARRGELWEDGGALDGVGVEPPTPRRGAATRGEGMRPGRSRHGWGIGRAASRRCSAGRLETAATGGRACDRDGHATWGVELVAGLAGVVTGARLDGGVSRFAGVAEAGGDSFGDEEESGGGGGGVCLRDGRGRGTGVEFGVWRVLVQLGLEGLRGGGGWWFAR